MPDRIVQLTDDQDVNIYPLAGGVAANSITTNMVQNGAITSNKTDFTTYSTTNEIACGTWIDGRTIYKKTINFGTLPNATSKTVPHGISGLSMIIRFEGYAYRSGGDGTIFPIPYAASGTAAISVTANSTNVVMGTGVDRSNMGECYITLYYVKTSS